MSNRALLPFSKMTGLLSTVSSKLEPAIVKIHRRTSLCCIIVLSEHMIGYWFFVKGCRLDRILSSQRPRLPSITSLSRFYSLFRLCRERDFCSKSNLRHKIKTSNCWKIKICHLTKLGVLNPNPWKRCIYKPPGGINRDLIEILR